ncbi:hypothetical protein GPECTOR_19g340 [Gonium pectorale]|uniref:Uncharacterized protein n=1 Tax=Gonium pectorale TaxID=33097 RepID=A0A150GJA6_GONPE|nr:hypothetical protein GPECTOR_19g340 [Gonium pectorale]|eukprot:KXZ49889.1 hypothetical protein GPECTOR_19g340 [Gonium pectorale]
MVEHLHISKSGGTSFSAAARLSNCRKDAGLGQPTYLGDFPHWLNRTAMSGYTQGAETMWSLWGKPRRDTDVQTCEERLEAISSRGLQYVSNEYTLHGGLGGMHAAHVCAQLVNVVTLRNPDKRLVSHMHFMLAFLSSAARRKNRPRDLFNRVFCSNNLTIWRDVAPPVIDNFNVRSFLGEAGFHTPLGTLGSEHVGLARQQLLTFDLVMDLDAGSEATEVIMRQGLGWSATVADVQTRTSHDVSKKMNFSVDAEGCRNEKLLAEVLPLQEPDRQLYRTGRVVSFLDRLLMSAARSLGLHPHPTVDTSAEEARRLLDAKRHPCGLLSFAPRAPPLPEPAAGRGVRKASTIVDGAGVEGDAGGRVMDFRENEAEEEMGEEMERRRRKVSCAARQVPVC